MNEEFGKNLGKWNDGITRDLQEYNNWVFEENSFWQKINLGSSKSKKELF